MLAANVGVLRQRALLTRPLVAVWLFFQIPASAHPVSKGEKVCVCFMSVGRWAGPTIGGR